MKKRIFFLFFLIVSLSFPLLFNIPRVLALDSSFGNTTIEANTVNFEDYIRGSNHTCLDDGEANNITAYIQVTTTAKKVKCALYFMNDTLVTNGATEERTISANGASWQTFNFVGTKPTLVASTEYRITAWCESKGGQGLIYNDLDFGSERGAYDSETYNGFPNPASFSTDARGYSIYCNYTVSVGEEENVFGVINQQFSIDSHRTWSLNRYSLITQTFSLTSGLIYSLNRYGIINQLFNIGSFVSKTVNKNVYGVVNQVFTLDSLRSYSLTRMGVINQQFSLASHRTYSLNRYGIINQQFSIESLVTSIGGAIRNVFGVINQQFTVNSHRTFALNRMWVITQVFTISSFVTSGVVQRFLGVIGQQFSVGFYKVASGRMEGVLQQLWAILGEPIFPAAAPTYATRGFVLAAILFSILVLVIAIPIGLLIIRKRK